MYCKTLLLWVAAILALLAIGGSQSADAAPMEPVRRRQAVNGIRMPIAGEAAARSQGGMAPPAPAERNGLRDNLGNAGRFAPIPAAINRVQPVQAAVCFLLYHDHHLLSGSTQQFSTTRWHCVQLGAHIPSSCFT